MNTHSLTIHYRVFGNDLSGTFSQLDTRHANYNGASGYTYKVTVQDNGEPGAGADTFTITVYNSSSAQVYTDSGTLGGGNIEIHN